MKRYLGALIVLAAISVSAQTTSLSQIQHIETALNHLTVIDIGEPVEMVAVADPDSIQIERHGDKVFLMPLKKGVATNLFVWTASRQLAYEIDPAGDLARMNVVIRNAPPPGQEPNHDAASSEPSDQLIQKIASLVLPQAMMGSENIVRESPKAVTSGVSVELERVFRANDAIYVRYTISNQTAMPYRMGAPEVREDEPTGQPISLLALRNCQLSLRTYAAFKSKPGKSVPVVTTNATSADVPPGRKSTGVVTIQVSRRDQPKLYHLHFGSSQKGEVAAEVVL